jgi:periplasmic divalent cation tolerance protein
MPELIPIMLLYSPFPSPQAARDAARTLLTEKLVACCNVVPAVESHYWWKGTLTQSSEVVLWCKTSQQHASLAAARLEAIHPYECPAIVLLSGQANQAFAIWVKESTNL